VTAEEEELADIKRLMRVLFFTGKMISRGEIDPIPLTDEQRAVLDAPREKREEIEESDQNELLEMLFKKYTGSIK